MVTRRAPEPDSRSLSRREFVFTSVAAATFAAFLKSARQAKTAQEIADLIRSKVGVAWRDRTVDGFKAGDPATPVTGIATSVMATVDGLRRAAASRHNLIITQEPTFYAADDVIGNRATDAVYLAKKQIIDDTKLVIWRFSDHWNARQPNEAVTALAAELGWKSPVQGSLATFQISETSLGALVTQIRSRLDLRGGVRVVGRSSMRVKTVFLSPGSTDLQTTVRNLPHVDVIVAGEPREWEAMPYALDTWTAGAGDPKGLVSIGRVVSEGPGMRACAAWLRALVPGLPVEALPVPDPYWSPLA
jgi:putative NIF3 family GTP cyclohydrolase 1 type 2